MKGLTLMSQRFLRSKSSPTAVDFIVLLALIAVAWLTTIASIGTHAAITF
jgi:Flp pilus assembly pilin Flp